MPLLRNEISIHEKTYKKTRYYLLQKTCQFHQVATSQLKSGLLQHVICKLVKKVVETTCSKPVDNKFWQATSKSP